MRCYHTEDIRWGEWTGRDINSPLGEKKGNLKSRWCKEEIEKGTKRETDACLTLGALWKYYSSVLLESSHISVLTLK